MRNFFTVLVTLFIGFQNLPAQSQLYGLLRMTDSVDAFFPQTYLCTIDITNGQVALVSNASRNFYFNSSMVIQPFSIDPTHNSAYFFEQETENNDTLNWFRIYSAPLASGSFMVVDSMLLPANSTSLVGPTYIQQAHFTSHYSTDPTNGDVYFFQTSYNAQLDTLVVANSFASRYFNKPVHYDALLHNFTTGNLLADTFLYSSHRCAYDFQQDKLYTILSQRLNNPLVPGGYLQGPSPLYSHTASSLTFNQSVYPWLGDAHTLWTNVMQMSYCQHTNKLYSIFQYSNLPPEICVGLPYTLGELDPATGENSAILSLDEYDRFYDIAVDHTNGIMCMTFADSDGSNGRIRCVDLLSETLYPSVQLQLPLGYENGMVVEIESMPGTLVMGMEEMADSLSLRLYPNPATNYIKVEMDINSMQEVLIHIVNITGKTIHSQTYSTMEEINIPVGHLANGVYLMQVFNGQKSITRRFVKN